MTARCRTSRRALRCNWYEYVLLHRPDGLLTVPELPDLQGRVHLKHLIVARQVADHDVVALLQVDGQRDGTPPVDGMDLVHEGDTGRRLVATGKAPSVTGSLPGARSVLNTLNPCVEGPVFVMVNVVVPAFTDPVSGSKVRSCSCTATAVPFPDAGLAHDEEPRC